MAKTILFIFVSLFLISCGKGGGGGGSSDKGGAEVSLSEISTSSPVPSAALNFDVNVKLVNFDSVQEDKVLAAADLLRKVVASEAFKNKILNHTYNGKKTFVDNGGLTNAQIYKKIIEGAEKLFPSSDNEMDLELEIYHDNTIVVGYTMPNTVRIWMNGKYFNRNSAYQVTDNMMHEWLHKLGFGHAQNASSSRPYSVPYAIGYLTRDLARTMQ